MDKFLTLKEASRLLGVKPSTLRSWDNEGMIRTIRTLGNQRRVPYSEVVRVLADFKGVVADKKLSLIYARCSTKKQEENLDRQIERLVTYCKNNGLNYEIYSEIASGLNDNRKEFLRLIKRLAKGDVNQVIVEYKDRLTRFGFNYFKAYCENFGVTVLCLEEKPNKEFEQELTEDIISLVTSYSARIYGKRGGRKKLRFIDEDNN